MKKPFCDALVSACGADLALAGNYCDEHVEDNNDAGKVEYWSYPLQIDSKEGIHPTQNKAQTGLRVKE